MSAKEMIEELKADIKVREEALTNLETLLKIEREIGKPNLTQEAIARQARQEIDKLKAAINKHG